ncbi:MAG: thiamine phosphate synthase [bacterium]|nr:thiamine phosphate synthase [bacterium]
MNTKTLQIIDANINRITEGLRVVEEIVRFIIKDAQLTKQIKTERHKVRKLSKKIETLECRDTPKDLGKNKDFDTYSYKNILELTNRNFKRAQEGCRVIEEFTKLLDTPLSSDIKEIRFKIYDIEKTTNIKLSKCLSAKNKIDFSFYVILDKKYIKRNDSSYLTNIVTDLCKNGITIVQLREKSTEAKSFLEDALLIRKITQEFNIPFIINDRLDIALAVNADGVHLGETDMPIQYAKKLFPGKIIGSSVNTVEKAKTAEKMGADYLGVGCLFPSKTASKPITSLNILAKIKSAVHIPVLGIGGITLSNLSQVLSIKADGICVAGDLFDSSNITKRTKQFKSKIITHKII